MVELKSAYLLENGDALHNNINKPVWINTHKLRLKSTSLLDDSDKILHDDFSKPCGLPRVRGHQSRSVKPL